MEIDIPSLMLTFEVESRHGAQMARLEQRFFLVGKVPRKTQLPPVTRGNLEVSKVIVESTRVVGVSQTRYVIVARFTTPSLSLLQSSMIYHATANLMAHKDNRIPPQMV